MSFGYSIHTITTGTTNSDNGVDIYLCDCTLGNITLNLNDNDADGKFYWIKRIDATINVLTIETSGTGLLDLNGSMLILPLQSIYLVKSGSVWRVMMNYISA